MKIHYAMLIIYFFAGMQACEVDNASPIPVTVWVHGSFVGPDFILHDFFFRHRGMVKATDYAPRYHSRDMALSLFTADPIQYPMEHLYFWGWSGKLSRRTRKKEAETLYEDLLQLVDSYQIAHPNRPIYLRLISHSHGGNVLLNLAEVQHERPLIIDELIFLSCPVQYATKDFIHTDRFKKIYSFYSADLYQVIDFQCFKKNGRTIKKHSDRRFQEISKLHQAKIKINGRALLHIEFMLDKFIRHIPRLCTELDSFYASLTPKEQQREKLLHIKTAHRNAQVRKKLF